MCCPKKPGYKIKKEYSLIKSSFMIKRECYLIKLGGKVEKRCCPIRKNIVQWVLVIEQKKKERYYLKKLSYKIKDKA